VEGASRHEVVRAYGAVVVEPGTDGSPVVVVVHRPRYGDWSLPKGKAEPGERPEATVLREVEEETGLSCGLGPYLGETRYRDREGRAKAVGYWLARVRARRPRPPDAEVDEVAWWPLAVALERLSHPGDRELVRRAAVVEGRAGPGQLPRERTSASAAGPEAEGGVTVPRRPRGGGGDG
jgi:8-oxo-dGTP pyrophosphatase MutT (NUDIX family)